MWNKTITVIFISLLLTLPVLAGADSAKNGSDLQEYILMNYTVSGHISSDDRARWIKKFAEKHGYTNKDVQDVLINNYEGKVEPDVPPRFVDPVREHAVINLKDFPTEETVDIYKSIVYESESDRIASSALSGYVEVSGSAYDEFTRNLLRDNVLGKHGRTNLYGNWLDLLGKEEKGSDNYKAIYQSIVQLVLNTQDEFYFQMLDKDLVEAVPEYEEQFREARIKKARKFLQSDNRSNNVHARSYIESLVDEDKE